MFFRQFLDKRNHNGLLILAILFLFISTSSHSQFVLYDNTSTGLPINKATSIGVTLVEDIFIGTRDQGIIHKSVLGWDNYYKPVTSNFPNNYIQDVYVAGSEVIISTQYGGVGIFKGQGWTTMNSSTTSGNIPDDQVEAACYDSKGNLWMATFLGLVMDSVASDEWKLFNMSNFPVMPTNHITKLVIDSKDIKWMGTSDGVLRLKDSVFTLY
ncbi:MAG TPA: two-component regulator propeller domain-containing protein, partial [Cytophagaceae bacterium]